MHNNITKKLYENISFSGICAAIKLKKELNIDAQLFELSKDVGGTWFSNTYPGAECDIPSHLYSLSFELNDSKYLFKLPSFMFFFLWITSSLIHIQYTI